MPALYRMPVAYVTLLLLVLAWWLFAPGSRENQDAPPAAASIRQGDPEEPQPVREIVEKSEPPIPPSETDQILRTQDGLRRKVMITDLDVVPSADPNGASAGSKPLDYLGIFFVFAQTPEMVQVGRAQSPEGWIPRRSTLEWNTRLMARPTDRAGRASIEIYEDRACLEAEASGGQCPRHGGRCPIVGEESPEVSGGSASVLGWPVLSAFEMQERNGAILPLLEVAPLVEDRPGEPSEPPEDLRRSLRTVYIGFVIDTTASMQSAIDSVRETAAKLAESAGKSYGDVNLRLGLVAYRDKSPVFGYAAKRVTGFTDPGSFTKALAGIEAAKRGDGSVSESVLEGVGLALPGGPDHLDWPTGREAELATRLIVLIGDAPDHDEKLYRARALADLARQNQITIATVALRSPTLLSKAEKSRYEAQWTTLAEASYRPADRRQGFAKPIPPQRLSLNETGELVSTLVALIDARIERARQLAAIALAEAEGRLTQYVNSQGLTAQQVAPLLVDLHRRESSQAGRPNLKSDGRKAPTIRRGWILARKGGRDLVGLQMLMSRDELDLLIRELTPLQQVIRGSASDLSRLIQVENASVAGETTFLKSDRQSETFATHLERRQGIVLSRPDSLLRRTKADLMRADSIDRAALDARLSESLLGLVRRRNDPDWTTPGRTVDGKALVPFSLIDF